jgi:ABC-type transport system substrate-binding protein
MFHNTFKPGLVMVIVLKIEKGERSMQRKIILSIVILLMLLMLTGPVFAWVYPDGSKDAVYEEFGPRADNVLIKLYATDAQEFAALEAQQIDICDWPIPKAKYVAWTAPPYSDYINVVNYGPEFGLNILDMNSNPNKYMGRPPSAARGLNPVGDQDDTVGNPKIKGGDPKANNYNPMSNLYMRRAIAYLVNRDAYIADPSIGAGFGYPMYTTMPPAMEKYVLDVYGDVSIPWSWMYSRVAANSTLDANGFPVNPATGYRYWDRNGDHVEQADEWVELLFYIRLETAPRLMIGQTLLLELAAVKIRVNAQLGNSPFTGPFVMYQKDFHLYTGGWSLGVDPDSLILWSWDYYQHPGFCYNYGGHNDPAFNAAAAGVMYANNQEEAVAMCLAAQFAQCDQVLGVPIYCVSGNKGYSKTYTSAGPNNGKNWIGVTNEMGYGIDNFWSFLNMHPTCPMVGDGSMVIQWGFKTPKIEMKNPIYSQWLWEWNAMGLSYESLLARNASNLGQFLPWMVKTYDVGLYTHPVYGTCSRVRFTLRDDIYWSDGTKMTIADIYFTFVELKKILSDRGLPDPWWYSNVADILSFSILDPCNFEVLLDVKSYWVVGWIGGNIILPKHIWKPIASTGNVEGPMPDPNLVCTGPWKFGAYEDNAYYRADKNPLYFRSTPLDVEIKLVGTDPALTYRQKIKPGTPPTDAWFVVTMSNLKKMEPGMATAEIWVDKWIYFTNKTAGTKTLIRGPINVHLVPGVPNVEIVTLGDIATALGKSIPSWPRCSYDIDVEVHIKGPPEFCPTQPNPWICKWKNVTFDWWGTIKEDIGGSYYYNPQLPAPDCKVDIKDVAVAAKAFGSYPGHAKWNTVADINLDYKIDIKDIASIAKKFGWIG